MTRTHTGLFRLLLLSAAVLAASAAYLLTDSKLYDLRLFAFALKLRLPALAVMLIASCSIGAASLIFQTIINNRIVTPCLLGMNSMYSLVHTAAVFFFGSGSILAVNANLARQAMKTGRHALLIPCSALMGMLAVIGGQLMTEHLFSFSVPVSTLITMGGGIYFLYLLLFKKEGGY